MVVLGWCWVGEVKVFWASELCRQAGALVFYAAEPSLDLALLSHIACLALVLFIVSHGQMVWLFITLLPWLFGTCIFSTALALNVLSAEHVIAVPEGACGSYCLHICPVWLLLHIPVISYLVFSPSCSSCPALLVQEMIVSARARFFKHVSLPAVTSLKPYGETSTSSFHISVGVGHIPSSCQWAWRCEGDRTDVSKGVLRKMSCFESWNVYVIIFLYKGTRGPSR